MSYCQDDGRCDICNPIEPDCNCRRRTCDECNPNYDPDED